MERAVAIAGIEAGLARKTLRRVAIPAVLFMLLSSVDRVNVSFAALQMNAELKFSPSQYGFGAGIVFVGYLIGQYPSILLLQRIGMRAWISTIAIGWGLCAGGLAFISTHEQFYVLRFLLGLAEGGLAPGIVLYLSQFATERDRATTFALPMLAIPLSIIVGGPISGWLMEMASPVGLSGWRWMFLGEALPTLALGFAAIFYFPDRPSQARWLSGEEREYLQQRAANRPVAKVINDWSVLANPIIWLASALWFCLLAGSYGIIFWLPQIVGQLTKLTPLEIGLVNSLPWIGNVVGIYLNSRHSDSSGERYHHVGIPAGIAALAISTASLAGASAIALVALLVAGTALGAAQGAFWAIPTRMFTSATFAVGSVAINIAGSIGGLIIPQGAGFLREKTGDFAAPTWTIAVFLIVGVGVVYTIRSSYAKFTLAGMKPLRS